MTTFLGGMQSSACSPKQDCDKKYFLNIAEIFRIKKGLARGMVDTRKKYPKLPQYTQNLKGRSIQQVIYRITITVTQSSLLYTVYPKLIVTYFG